MDAVLRLCSDRELSQRQSTCKHLSSLVVLFLHSLVVVFLKWFLSPVDVCRCGPGVFAHMCPVSEVECG